MFFAGRKIGNSLRRQRVIPQIERIADNQEIGFPANERANLTKPLGD